jgi:hypothetical protein
MRCAQKVFSREQVGGSYRQSAVYRYMFGAEPPMEAQHTSRGDVDALVRIVQDKRVRATVSASARLLHDISGQHMLASRVVKTCQ